MLFWLLLLGFITYLIVQRSVSGITRTPVWLLWLVMMTPALIWTIWALRHGDKQPLPVALVIIPFVACPLLYWFLVQQGRRLTPGGSGQQPATPPGTDPTAPPAPETPPPRLLDPAETSTLQNCFPWSVYYLQNIEYRPQAVICRGQLRASAEVAYQTIRENITHHFGDRFLVVLQDGLNGKPFFALVPNPQLTSKPRSEALNRPGLALALLATTLFTTSQAGVELVNGMSEALPKNPLLLWQGLPYALALMSILGIHELGHYLAARHYKIQATLPYFIPVPWPLFSLGTFGAFIQLRSPIPHRKSLFDIGIAGPFAGLVVALPLLLWGLAHSSALPLSPKSNLFSFHALDPGVSLLLSLLSRLAMGSTLQGNQGIDLHPVAIAGYLGLIVTALNLMPVGQLDGGHIVHAMFGQRGGAAISQISRLLFLLMAFLDGRGLVLWAILLFLIPATDEPALNDVSELDNRRDFLGLLALGFLVLILLPAPKVLMEWLF
ncbi:peptidase M50 [Neosynechococcus sphagnicola sy1]|uniref:Peptidase M50 n=1 Tax=Neosynechococcus sphagnicola sy1 TaxID=1497020 RepID=A0A098TIT0_9CYAN|nr:site-2 protease family protein [Neosynechococcus sphagnicola]KGF71999.1 peptidase M50 [Neosynechococcus sphagnicola sy1]